MNNPYREKSKVNPQPGGNGTAFRQINAAIWCALTAAKLSGPCYQLVLYFINQTWGYQKQSTRIGYAAIRAATRLSRMTISKSIQQLKSARIIIVEKGNIDSREPSEYMFNKYYDTWCTSIDVLTSKDVLTHTSKDVLTSTSKDVLTNLGTTNKKKLKKEKDRDITFSLNKKNNEPDRSEKYFAGTYGHMVQK